MPGTFGSYRPDVATGRSGQGGALAVGEGLYAALGYDASTGDEPAWVLLLMAVVTLGVFIAPCAAAVVYGQRAHRAGDRRAMVPYFIGGVIGLWFVILTVVTTVDALVS